MILSNDFGAPPSTSTKPSPVENARTLLPPPSTTVIWSVKRRTPPSPGCPLGTRASGDAFHPSLLNQRQVDIPDGGALRQHDMLAAEPHLAVAAADHDVRLRVV